MTGERTILNDFVVKRGSRDRYPNDVCKLDQDHHRGRQMSIRYCLTSKAYLIRDLGLGLGTFIMVKT